MRKIYTAPLSHEKCVHSHHLSPSSTNTRAFEIGLQIWFLYSLTHLLTSSFMQWDASARNPGRGRGRGRERLIKPA